MEILFKIVVFVFFLYGFFILWIAFGCFKIKWFHPKNKKPKNTFTIIVSFRNEKENLPILLNSFSKLDYPKELFEVILVDDNQSSEDSEQEEIVNLISSFNITYSIIQNERKTNSPKKDAINTAVRKAKSDWIITTDADCEVPKKWLSVLDDFIQENQKAKMVCGMVFTKYQKGFLSRFQLLDFMSLQSATIGTFGIGKPFMCNGANFAYRKDFFEELNGFSGNENTASGDDVFLLQKAIEKSSENVFYLKSKDFLIRTNSLNSWKELFFQRVRWASKTKSYKSGFSKILALVIFIGNICFLVSIFYSLIYDSKFLWFVGFKIIIDLILLVQTHKVVPKFEKYLFLISSFVYPVFSFCVGTYILFNKNYIWKGRKFRLN